MFNNGGGDVRSGLAPYFRDSSSKPSDHALTDMWQRQALLRDKYDRSERDKYSSAKRDSAMDARASFIRSSNAVFSNVVSSGPSAKRRVLGRHGPSHENGRYGSVVGRSLESVSHVRSPPENGKAERDLFSSAGGPRLGYSSSLGTEKPGKGSDGSHFRGSHLSPCETRPASSPRFDRSPQFDPVGKLCRSHNACDGPGPGIWERERSKFSSSSIGRDIPKRDKERAWGRPEYHRRTYSLPKLDFPRDWSAGDRELFEGRIDRYGSASGRELAVSEVSSISSKERYRYDWRTRDRNLFGTLSSHSPICAPSSNWHLKDIVATPARLEEPRPKSPPGQLDIQNSLMTQHNSDMDAGPFSPKKRPRLTWGQGLAKYEKERIEDLPGVKKCEDGQDQVGDSHEDMHVSSGCQSRCTKNGSISPPHNQHSGREQSSCDSGVSENGGELERSLIPRNLSLGFQFGTQVILEDQSKADVVQLNLSVFPRKNLVYGAAAPETSILHEAQVLLSNVLRDRTGLSKDVVTYHVEKVEQEIDRLEKKLIKLGTNQVEEIVGSYDTPNLKIEVQGGDSFGTTVSGLESPQGHCEDSCAIAIACDEALPSFHNDNIHSQVPEALNVPQTSQDATGQAQSDTGGCDAHDTVLDMNAASGQLGELQCEGGHLRPSCEVTSADKDGGPAESIILSNRRTADMSLASLAHLNLPKVESGRLYDTPQHAGVWRHNADIHCRKRKCLEAKIVEEKALVKFQEKVLAVKFRAYREACKLKQSGVDLQMERGGQENIVNHSECQSSFDLHHNPVPMIRSMENVKVQTSQFLNSSSSSELERGFLKMPAMNLGSGERELHKFDTKNGLVDDPVSAEQERKLVNPWSKEEKKIFLEKYSLIGKDFRRISAYLEHKTVADCVEFYYRNQKTEEFEKVRQKHRLEKYCRYHLERHSVEQSAFYVSTSPSFNSRHYEGDSTFFEGLTLVAAAAAAMSTPTKPTYRGLATQACIKVVPTQFAVKGMRNVECKGARSTHSRRRASKEELNVHWSDNETQMFLDSLVVFGKEFDRISQHMGTKSAWQCRSFFSKARRHLGLDQLVERHQGMVQVLRAKNGTCAPFPKDRNTKPDSGAETVAHTRSVVSAEALDVNCEFKEARGPNVLESLQEIVNGVSLSSKTSMLDSVSYIPDDQVKQEACTISDSAEKSFEDASTLASSSQVGNAPLLDSVKNCRLDNILVCGETLQVKAEFASVKAEPSHTASEICNGEHSDINILSASLGASSAVSTSSPNSVPIASAVESTQSKDLTVKMMEPKVRREPTSWTHEEKNMFVEVLKVHGKNWDRLRESLPGKSLTQIKTYFQNSKAKLGFYSEGAVNSSGKGVVNVSGRVGSSRKRKVDDSDSSSNAGFKVHNVSQKDAVQTDDGNVKVSPSVFDSLGSIGSHAIAAELLYASLLSSNSVEDSGIAQKILQSKGLNSSSLTAGVTPILNSSVFTSSNLHSHQSYVHANQLNVQPVGLQQPQRATPPLMVVQPLQQQVGSPGIYQRYPPLSQSTSRVLQDLPLPVAQYLHKQPALLHSESNQEALLHQHQQQLVQQQVAEAVSQQHLPTQFLQRQQLQMLVQHVAHNHLQQMLSQHQQAQANQQVPNQVVSQLPQGMNQNPGAQLACGSPSISKNQQLQQQGEFAQLYQMHYKAPPLFQPQQLQLHWQQQLAQLQQVPAKQAHSQLSHLQPLNVSFLNQQHQQLAVLRGVMQATNSCDNAFKQLDSNNCISSRAQCCLSEDLHQPPLTSQGIQISTQFNSGSESRSRPTEVKLFGQSLLSQPASSGQHQSGNVTTVSSQIDLSSPFSISADKNVTCQALSDAVTHELGWPVVSSCSSTGLSNEGVESELCSVQEALARTNERLIRGVPTNKDGEANESFSSARASVHISAEQASGSRAMSHMLLCDFKRPDSDENSRSVQDSDKFAKKSGLQVFQPPPLGNQGASHGLPRVLDALVALAEWRIQNANDGSEKLMDEFLSQSWEALQRDPGSLVEAGKAGGSVTQFYTGNLEVQRH